MKLIENISSYTSSNKEPHLNYPQTMNLLLQAMTSIIETIQKLTMAESAEFVKSSVMTGENVIKFSSIIHTVFDLSDEHD